jgi:hypothetical protein
MALDRANRVRRTAEPPPAAPAVGSGGLIRLHPVRTALRIRFRPASGFPRPRHRQRIIRDSDSFVSGRSELA